MPARTYPTGLVREDARRHAARRGVFGYRALCGAGKTRVVRDYELFDPYHPFACPACRQLVSAPGD